MRDRKWNAFIACTFAPLAVVIIASMASCVGYVGDSGQIEPDASSGGGDAAAPDSASPSDISAATLLAALPPCNDRKGGPFASDNGRAQTVYICAAKDALFWQSDMDIDCDGKPSEKCNAMTDPYFMSQTAAGDSRGDALDAAALPYVVIPKISAKFDYRMAGLAMGSVVAVIYKDKLEFGIIGDAGPAEGIGEASYAMAERLGINPNPRTGGTSDPVTYIAFTGPTAKVRKNEDHGEAVMVGKLRAAMFLAP